jgi:hypothetical protein
MAVAREDKKAAVEDHFGALQSYLDALRLMVGAFKDSRVMCSFELIIENAEKSRRAASELVEELLEDASGELVEKSNNGEN